MTNRNSIGHIKIHHSSQYEQPVSVLNNATAYRQEMAVIVLDESVNQFRLIVIGKGHVKVHDRIYRSFSGAKRAFGSKFKPVRTGTKQMWTAFYSMYSGYIDELSNIGNEP